MGAINYKTDKYITLAINPYDFDDVKAGYLDYLINDTGMDAEQAEEELTDEAVYEQINSYYEADFDNAESYIHGYNFSFFRPSVESGYYEGMQILLNDDFCFWDEDDRKACLEELPELKNLLVDLAGCGYVSCYPWWCTTYHDYKETKKDIDEAIEKMRADIEAMEV